MKYHFKEGKFIGTAAKVVDGDSDTIIDTNNQVPASVVQNVIDTSEDAFIVALAKNYLADGRNFQHPEISYSAKDETKANRGAMKRSGTVTKEV